MRYLLDSGLLLRIVDRDDPLHDETRAAVRALKQQRHSTVTTMQNMAEFWNVCTRPASARGGLGLSHEQAARRLRLVERIAVVMPDPVDIYQQWRELVFSLKVQGVQVHDARLAAFMLGHGLTHVLSLNKPDFARFSSLTVLSPRDVIGPTGQSPAASGNPS